MSNNDNFRRNRIYRYRYIRNFVKPILYVALLKADSKGNWVLPRYLRWVGKGRGLPKPEETASGLYSLTFVPVRYYYSKNLRKRLQHLKQFQNDIGVRLHVLTEEDGDPSALRAYKPDASVEEWQIVESSVTLSSDAPVVGTAISVQDAPADATYAWSLGSTADGEFTAIADATEASYTPVSDDTGKFLRCTVTAGTYTLELTASTAIA